MSDRKITYWLYMGKRVLTAVRLPEGSTDYAVRQHAIDQEIRVPIGHNFETETPLYFRNLLARAKVKCFVDSPRIV